MESVGSPHCKIIKKTIRLCLKRRVMTDNFTTAPTLVFVVAFYFLSMCNIFPQILKI